MQGKNCEAGRDLLKNQMLNFADKDLDRNPFEISEEDVVDASPDFNIIDEDGIDDELDIL